MKRSIKQIREMDGEERKQFSKTISKSRYCSKYYAFLARYPEAETFLSDLEEEDIIALDDAIKDYLLTGKKSSTTTHD